MSSEGEVKEEGEGGEDGGALWSVIKVDNGQTFHWVDTVEGLHAACAAIHSLASESSSPIAIDLEGVALSRHGELCVVQVATGRTHVVWGFDIVVLGAASFAVLPEAAAAEQQHSLGTLLHDPALQKLFWDCRSDCNALYYLYGIRPCNVLDLQLLEVAQRLVLGRPASSVTGLGVVIERTPHARLSKADRARIASVKAQALALFSPKEGGAYAVWKERPLRPVLREYCTDAALFFTIQDSLLAGAPGLRSQEALEALRAATHRRVLLSFSLQFDEVKTNKALAIGVDSLLVKELRTLGLVAAAIEAAGAAEEGTAGSSGGGGAVEVDASSSGGGGKL